MPADLGQTGLMLAALASGLFFSLVGIGYKLGDQRQVPALYIALTASSVGVTVFLIRNGNPLHDQAPGLVWLVGLVVGLGQYGTVPLIRYALAHGPLSPMWCASCLNFLPAVIYAAVGLHEHTSGLQWLGVVVGVACVVVAAFEQQDAAAVGAHPATLGSRLKYGLALCLLLVLNSAPSVAMKYLGQIRIDDTATYLTRYANAYVIALYVGVLGCALLDFWVRRGPRFWRPATLLSGGVAAVGSVGGLTAVTYCTAKLPAAVVFTGSSIASILAAALVSVLAFGERRTAIWYATVGLAILAVILLNLHPGG